MGFMDSMKDFAGKIGESVEKGAKTVSDGSKKIVDKSKIKREISRLEKEINDSYIEIGKKYFEKISELPSDEYSEAVDSIKSNMEELEKAKQQLMKLEDKINCPNCGEPVLRSQKFCDKCGAKVSVDEPESTVTVEKTCPNCGETVPGDQLYCANCGAKIE